MKALILAAGYAVRLKPLTSDTPKPLLEIGKRKIIDRILAKLAAVRALDSIYIITNAKFFDKFKDWLGGSRYKNRTSLVNDGSISNETRLGAIKDLAVAIREKHIEDDLLVVAGDNLFEFDPNEFLAFASKRRDGVSVALHDIKDFDAARRFGIVKVDPEDNRIIDFQEKPENPKSTLISTGIYYFPKEKIALIEKYLNSSDKTDAPGYYISWLSKTDKVYGFIFSQNWCDIGDIESFKLADSQYLKKGEKLK